MIDPTTLLEDTARALDLLPADVDRVKAHARARARRRRSGVAVLTSVSLLAGAGVVVLRSGTADEGAPVAVVGAAAVRGDVPMQWQKVDPGSGLGMARDVGSGDLTAPLYALSTAPGSTDVNKARPSRVVWRSEDGVEWSPASTLGGDLYLSDLSSTDRRVFAVGTAPAVGAGGRAVSPPILGWSDDGAKTWQRANVDLDVSAIAARSLSTTVAGSDIGSGPDGTLAVLTLSATLDVPALLPDGRSAPHGWAVTADGVDLLGPLPSDPCPDGMTAEKGVPRSQEPIGEAHGIPCFRDGEFVRTVPAQEAQGVTASYRWADLGVEGDLLRAVRRQPFAFFAASDSTDFRRVDLPATDPVLDVLVQPHAAGFDVAATTMPPMGAGNWGQTAVTLLETEDGSSWTAGGTPGGLQWVHAIGRLDGSVAMVGATGAGSAIARADGAGGWTTTDLSSAIDPGVLDGGQAYVSAAAIGPLGAVVGVTVVPSDGRESGAHSQRILVSREGRTWSDVDVDDLAGRPIRSIARVHVAGFRAIVTASVRPESDRRDAHEQVVLVGAPA